MIETTTVNGRPAQVAYLGATPGAATVEPDQAVLIKVLFLDAIGGVAFLDASGTGTAKSKAWAAARAQALQTLARLREFDPDEPRDDDGKWTSGSGGGGGVKQTKPPKDAKHPGAGYSKNAWVDDGGVIHTSNVYDAQRALFEDRKVELNQVKQVSTLIRRLGETAAEMAEQGEKAPVFNLCNVTVKGTNLLCADQKGIPRAEMPVIPAKRTKDFIKHLKSLGYEVEKGKERSENLRATQSEIDGAKVAVQMERIRKDGFYKRLVISKDDYILDGHHTWAGELGLDAQDNNLHNDKEVKIARVNISIVKLIEIADKWTKDQGIAKKPVGQRAATLREFDPNQPRDDDGKWTDGGGGGSGGGAATKPAGDKPPVKLDPVVTEVGGDEWNQATAKRLEREFQAARPNIEALEKKAVGSGETIGGGEDDDENIVTMPEEWDMLSQDDQQEAKEVYVAFNKSSAYDSEAESWAEEYANDEAKAKVAEDFKLFHGGEDWAAEAINEVLDAHDEAGTPIPFDSKQLLDAISIEYEAQGGSYPKVPAEIAFDDSKLSKPEGFDSDQQTLPGMDPLKPHEMLTPEMRLKITNALMKAFDKEANKVAGSLEAPDYLMDSAIEFLEEDWDHNLDDDYKFSFVKNSTNILDKYEEDAVSGTAAINEMKIDRLPTKYDPLNTTSGDDYKRTQALARNLSRNRLKEILDQRGLAVPSDQELRRVDNKIWQSWKSSSTSDDGKLIQVASAEELGGRLNAQTSQALDPASAKERADRVFASIGGYAGIKAAIRSKWEVTQYLLNKAGADELQLYRGLTLDQELVEKLFGPRKHADAGRVFGALKYMPSMDVKRNGAASTTVALSVANGWRAGSPGKVTLRAVVPRTAALSIPAYGINEKSEQEVVIAGTAWKGWDVWRGEAPDLARISLRPAA